MTQIHPTLDRTTIPEGGRRARWPLFASAAGLLGFVAHDGARRPQGHRGRREARPTSSSPTSTR